jgi:hypothetical protein
MAAAGRTGSAGRPAVGAPWPTGARLQWPDDSRRADSRANSDRSPADLAAAVERMIAMRATGYGSYAETAGAYRADEAAVRKLSADLQGRLKLLSSQQW